MRGFGKAGGLVLCVLAIGLIAFSAGRPDDCDTDSSGDAGSLSSDAKDEIPSKAARMYVAMAEKWNLDVAFLASIGKQECDHGRCGTLNQVNGSGCVGWMQLGVGGKCGHYWNRNRCDGNDDGKTDVLDPWDNICASAKGLRKEKGAPPTGGSEAKYRAAAGNYYGACVGNGVNYCDEVMARAKHYGFRSGTPTTTLAGFDPTPSDDSTDDPAGPAAGQCDNGDSSSVALEDGPGKAFTLLATANRAGVKLTPEMTAVVRRVAGRLLRRLTVCTGTNHNRLTTSGNVSDHYDGNGVDLCSSANGFPATGGGYGDTIATAALTIAGKPENEAAAMARKGGAFTLTHGGLRFQIIWKDQTGGNHNDHIHIGIARSGARA